MIIFRVLKGNSWKNARESNELNERISTAIQFARGGSTSTGDIEEQGPDPPPLGGEDDKHHPLAVDVGQGTERQDAPK
jgi:hypothetical protein